VKLTFNKNLNLNIVVKSINFRRIKIIKHKIWEYNEFKQFFALRKFFNFLNNKEHFDLKNIKKNQIQQIYLLESKSKNRKISKYTADLEYSFAMETIFCSIPQAFLQTYISIDEMIHNKYNIKQLIIQSIRILLACFNTSESSTSFIEYFSSYLFDIDISFLFVPLRIFTNMLFFTSRLLCILLCFYYFNLIVSLIIVIHFIIYLIFHYIFLLNLNNSKLVNLFISFFLVCFKMLTYFEDASFDKFYMLHNLIVWIENILMAYSFINENNYYFKYYILYFTIFSFIISILIEFFIIRHFFKSNKHSNIYCQSIITESFKETNLQFDSLFLF
jgi:hypothetical protein